MASSIIDLSDSWTLNIYFELMTFKFETLKDFWILQGPTPNHQQILQSLAHQLDLEYEYTLWNRTVRISRALSPENLTSHESSYAPQLNNPGAGLPNYFETHLNPTLDSVALLGPETWSSDFPLDPLPWEFNSAQQPATPATPPVPLLEETASDNFGDDTTWDEPSSVGRPTSLSGSAGSSISMQSTHSYRRSCMSETFSRRGSVRSRSSSGYEEIIFDANPSRSSSRASGARRGPLGAVAKAAMKAVKDVGACWKCRLLHKTCNPISPCIRCTPQRAKWPTNWQRVGCKRGALQDVMPRTLLCPVTNSMCAYMHIPQSDWGLQYAFNRASRHRSDIRDGEMVEDDSKSPCTPSSTLARLLPGKSLYGISKLSPTAAVIFDPLADCILDIHRGMGAYIVGEEGAYIVDEDFDSLFDEVTELLYAAARYQAEIDSDQLIASSLICMRSSLEVLHVQYCGLLDARSHLSCSALTGCMVECIADLDHQLNSYLKELSRVLFSTKTDDDSQLWLSTFYSFCIQAHVRNILCMVTQCTSDSEFPEQYLHLAIRLFVAKFRTYDPLKNFMATFTGQYHLKEYYRVARLAVKFQSWKKNGIWGSYGYLAKLFEDERPPLLCRRCRRQNIKCDNYGSNTPCGNCLKKRLKCEYQDVW